MKLSEPTVSSPCISQCSLNANHICIGCFRSIDEITSWARVDDKTKRQFLANIEHRQKSF